LSRPLNAAGGRTVNGWSLGEEGGSGGGGGGGGGWLGGLGGGGLVGSKTVKNEEEGKLKKN